MAHLALSGLGGFQAALDGRPMLAEVCSRFTRGSMGDLREAGEMLEATGEEKCRSRQA